MAEHVCVFPNVEILESEEGDLLQKGDQVLGVCPECGENALEHVSFLESRNEELQKSLLSVEPHRFLYHWAPQSRAKQIKKYGLRPNMRPTTNISEGFKAPYICFADSPSWAWALSGDQKHSESGFWDLWMVRLSDISEPIAQATPDRPSGLYEVRTEHRVYKSKIWYVGSRFK